MSTPAVPMGDLGAEYRELRDEIDEAIERVLTAGQLVLGEEVERFEIEFARYCEAKHAIGVGSGTAAVHLSLLAAGIGDGDEVITVSNTDIATTAAITHAGATIVWVDTDPHTFNMEWRLIEERITPRTRAILPVHLFGLPADMDPILDVARRHELLVIEDAALAVGAEYKDRRAGTIGAVGCFSLAPGKVFGAAGDAGVVVTDDSEIADRLRLLRNYGYATSMTVDERDLKGYTEWRAELEGFNERLDALQAAILGAKLATLDQRIERRRDAAKRYDRLLTDLDVTTPAVVDDVRHVYMAYTILLDKREQVRESLANRGVASRVYYSPPLHLQAAYRHMGLASGSFPVTEATSQQMLSLPLFPQVTFDQVDRVVEALGEALDERTGR